MNREDFSILDKPLIYFDNAATTLKPKCVLEAIKEFYNEYTANIHRGDYKNSLLASNKYESVREKVKDFINASSSDEIVFTSGTTEGLNMIVFGYFRNYLNKGDEVLLTKSEHASNVLSWFKLKELIGIEIKYIPLDSKGTVSYDNLVKAISPRTKVVSLAHITNVMGDVRDIMMVGEVCKEHNIKFVVDGAQSLGHLKMDVQKYNIDFLAFSAHKMYGPSGVGVLYGKYEMLDELEPMKYGGSMNALFHSDGYMELREVPTRLEAGTVNIEGVIAFGMAIDYLKSLDMDAIHNYEIGLANYLKDELSKLPFISIYNKNSTGSIVIFNINGVFAQDAAIYLDKYNICVRAGEHCAKLLGDDIGVNNTCRVSLSFYNTREEVDTLINVLKNSENIWKEIL